MTSVSGILWSDMFLILYVIQRGLLYWLESNNKHGQHLGICPNGTVKPPTETSKGKHGQFVVIVMLVMMMSADQCK